MDRILSYMSEPVGCAGFPNDAPPECSESLAERVCSSHLSPSLILLGAGTILSPVNKDAHIRSTSVAVMSCMITGVKLVVDGVSVTGLSRAFSTCLNWNILLFGHNWYL